MILFSVGKYFTSVQTIWVYIRSELLGGSKLGFILKIQVTRVVLSKLEFDSINTYWDLRFWWEETFSVPKISWI